MKTSIVELNQNEMKQVFGGRIPLQFFLFLDLLEQTRQFGYLNT